MNFHHDSNKALYDGFVGQEIKQTKTILLSNGDEVVNRPSPNTRMKTNTQTSRNVNTLIIWES